MIQKIISRLSCSKKFMVEDWLKKHGWTWIYVKDNRVSIYSHPETKINYCLEDAIMEQIERDLKQ